MRIIEAVNYAVCMVFAFDLFYQFVIIAKLGVVHVIEPNPLILYAELGMTVLVAFYNLHGVIEFLLAKKVSKNG